MYGKLRGALSYANVMATIAVFVALGGGAIAATGLVGKDRQIHGCVGKKGALSVLAPGKHCHHGQTAIAWSQTGPQGVPGAAGQQGQQGEQGPPGPLGAAGGDLAGDFPNPSIKDGSVTGAKVGADALTGLQILESSLGKVPSATNADTAADAQKLGGYAPDTYTPGCPTGTYLTVDLCADYYPSSTGATWDDAYNTCRARGKRLPTLGELPQTAQFTSTYWTGDIYINGSTVYAWSDTYNGVIAPQNHASTLLFFCVVGPTWHHGTVG